MENMHIDVRVFIFLGGKGHFEIKTPCCKIQHRDKHHSCTFETEIQCTNNNTLVSPFPHHIEVQLFWCYRAGLSMMFTANDKENSLKKSIVSLDDDHFLYSHDLQVCKGL